MWGRLRRGALACKGRFTRLWCRDRRLGSGYRPQAPMLGLSADRLTYPRTGLPRDPYCFALIISTPRAACSTRPIQCLIVDSPALMRGQRHRREPCAWCMEAVEAGMLACKERFTRLWCRCCGWREERGRFREEWPRREVPRRKRWRFCRRDRAGRCASGWGRGGGGIGRRGDGARWGRRCGRARYSLHDAVQRQAARRLQRLRAASARSSRC